MKAQQYGCRTPGKSWSLPVLVQKVTEKSIKIYQGEVNPGENNINMNAACILKLEYMSENVSKKLLINNIITNKNQFLLIFLSTTIGWCLIGKKRRRTLLINNNNLDYWIDARSHKICQRSRAVIKRFLFAALQFNQSHLNERGENKKI